MKFAHMFIALVTFSAPVSAFAADTIGGGTATAVVPTTTPSPKDRMICKSEDVPGSLIAKNKICLTAAQWKQRAFNSGQWAEHQETYNSQPNGH